MNKHDLLKHNSKPVEMITVPEWGEVHLRRLSFSEVDKFQDLQAKNIADSFAFLVCAGVVNADGTRVFDESDMANIKDNVPAEITFPIGKAVAKRIGVTFEAIEDSKKN